LRHVRNFEDYLEKGIAKRQSPDKLRAKSLFEESKKEYQIILDYIRKDCISKDNANFIIKSLYDVFMEIIRAKMLSQGFNSSGHGAHEAEVAFLRKIGFSEEEIEFADKLRYFRNKILYYGKQLTPGFAKKVIEFLEKAVKRL